MYISSNSGPGIIQETLPWTSQERGGQLYQQSCQFHRGCSEKQRFMVSIWTPCEQKIPINPLHICLSVSNRYGSWAVCFTYGTWFGVKGLIAAGKTLENSPAIRKACGFLLSKELPSGGWGESYLSSQDQVNSLIPVSLK